MSAFPKNYSKDVKFYNSENSVKIYKGWFKALVKYLGWMLGKWFKAKMWLTFSQIRLVSELYFCFDIASIIAIVDFHNMETIHFYTTCELNFLFAMKDREKDRKQVLPLDVFAIVTSVHFYLFVCWRPVSALEVPHINHNTSSKCPSTILTHVSRRRRNVPLTETCCLDATSTAAISKRIIKSSRPRIYLALTFPFMHL
jgi:hypothetical protein